MRRSGMNRAPKPKKCRWCRGAFTPASGTQVVCSPKCALSLAKEKSGKEADKERKAKEREYRADRRARKEKLKSRSDWAREAQAAVNAYVRLRDYGKPCISCGKPDDGSHQRHASHYRSVGACSALRFNLKNIHASCAQCNSSKSGNLIEYRISLCDQFGEALPLWLEAQNQPTRYSVDYLKRLKKVFSKRVRLKRNRMDKA